MSAFTRRALAKEEADFAQYGYSVRVMANAGAPGNGHRNAPPRLSIEGEPDLATGTLDDWIHYREKLATLAQTDETVRLAIAVTEARIAKLIRDARTRPWDR